MPYVDTTNHQTQSGLTPMLDAITSGISGSIDNYANARATLRGVGPALNDAGIPVNVPGPSILSRLISTIGGGLDGGASSPAPNGASNTPMSPAPIQPAGGSAPPAPGGNAFMPMFGNAIASIESGGKYDALGPATRTGDRAFGKYQVMGANIPSWTKEVLGQSLTPAQFLASPQAQDAVFNGKFGQYLEKTGNPQDAASMWFTGRPLAQGGGAQDQLGTTGNAYVSKFMAALPGGGGSGDVPQQATAYAPPSNQGLAGSPAGRAIAAATAPPAGPQSGPFGNLSGVQAAFPSRLRPQGDGPLPLATADGSTPQQVAGARPVGMPPGAPAQGQMPPGAPMQGPVPQSAGSMAPPGGPAQAGSAPAAPHEVIAPLMQNPQTQPIGAKLWQGALQQGKMGGTLALPAGMSAQSLAAMISEPQTQALGLAIWQKALSPQITSIEPNRAVFAGTRYIGQSPSGPITAHAGDVIVNPNPGGGVIAAVPPELQHTEIGRDAYGQPTYGSFNPQGGGVRPFPGGQTAATSGLGPDGQPLTGDAFLSTLPPQIAGQVKAIADGRVRLPTGMGANSPILQRVRAAVLQYDPSFDQAGVDARFETRADFAKGDAAKTITAGNTALIHLGELSDLADKLGNYDSAVPGNNALNWLKNNANSSSAAGAALAAFNATASKYVEEATKFYRGTGGTEGDISRDLLNISPNMSPTQLKAAIQAQIPLLQGKASALQGRWQQGMGPQAGSYPIFSPQAQSVINRISQSQAPGSGTTALPVVSPAQGGRSGQSPDGIPLLTDPSQMQALPPGTRFRTPDGQIRVRH